MKRRILFVDDEPLLLRALRNVLRRDSQRWEMVFVEGARAAMDELARAPFDVVVSDMRMPEIDGATLLESVRRVSPHTIRLILSGTAELDEVERAQGIADELLGKPCATATLRETIERWLGTLAQPLSAVDTRPMHSVDDDASRAPDVVRGPRRHTHPRPR